MIVDVWMQHPTRRLLEHDVFESLRRWVKSDWPSGSPGIEQTIASMDAGGVDLGLLSAWSAPFQTPLVSNEEVAECVRQHPDRFAGIAAVDLNKPMEALRELRRCIEDYGFMGLRVVPWLWDAPPTDRRYYPLYAACVDLGVPFFTQVGHTGPLRRSETGRPIPYIDEVALDFPELKIVCGHVGYPWTQEMISVCHKHTNVYIDTSAYTTKRLPNELIDYMRTPGGRQRVLFGTNYPMLTPARALDGLQELGLNREIREAYLGGNAQRLLGMTPTRQD